PPQAVLLEPLVFASRALLPVAVLPLPVRLLERAWNPMAVLNSPVVTLKSASSPRTVFSLVKQPCWQTACACGESAKQGRANGMSSKSSGQAKWFIECFNGRVVVFICARFCLFYSSHGNDKMISRGYETNPRSSFPLIACFLLSC